MEHPSPPPEVLARREIRIFISSTFRDMMRERDLLVKRVFPELRRKCAQRFVTFTEVDLRWGITSEQAAEGQVLPLCLAEIERSRPYFLGLLGERYGWIPDGFPAEIVERQPWLREHVQGRTSVTELEILHGVLNDPAMRGLAFFYFRDPGYANDPSLSEGERAELLERDIPAEVQSLGAVEAALRTEERKAKLAALKQRIRESGHPLIEPYANPEALADLVLRQFDELIDRLYPEPEVPDAVARERMAHEAHAKHKLFACIDRPAHLDALNAFAELPEHDGKGLVVTGESGCGKSALLAAWARDWIVSHPEDFLFQHYFGATPDSASPEGFLSRLLGELKAHFSIPDEIPPQHDKLREALPLWLAQSFGRGRVVLVLDGLNQVTGSDADRHLGFLPRHLPPNVAVISSTLSGPALDSLRERGWAEHELPLANADEIDAMVGSYLRIHARTLDPALLRELVSAPGSRNPLFLRTVLEELRQFGSFERLPERVRHYLQATDSKELFLRVIRRWQEDFDANDALITITLDLVRRALTHLWAAREGLSELELLDLLGPAPSPLPRAYWTPFFLAIEPHLSQRSGALAPGHAFLRNAIELAFLPTADTRHDAHLALADFFDFHPNQRQISRRKAAEWPWQLHAAAAWDRLEACLTNVSLFLSLYTENTKCELLSYWMPLRRQGRDMGKRYASLCRHSHPFASHSENSSLQTRLGQFLTEAGLYRYARPLLERALFAAEAECGRCHPTTLTIATHLAGLLMTTGHYRQAEVLIRISLDAQQRVRGMDHPETLNSAHLFALLQAGKGNTTAAEEILRRVSDARERVLGQVHPDTLTSVNCLGALLMWKPHDTEAEAYLRRVLETRERLFGPSHLATLSSVNNLGLWLYANRRDAEAEHHLTRALETRERLLGSEHPDTLMSMNAVGALHLRSRDYRSAESFLRRALEGLLKLAATTGRPAPVQQVVVENYAMSLHGQGHTQRHIQESLRSLGNRYGIHLRRTGQRRSGSWQWWALLYGATSAVLLWRSRDVPLVVATVGALLALSLVVRFIRKRWTSSVTGRYGTRREETRP